MQPIEPIAMTSNFNQSFCWSIGQVGLYGISTWWLKVADNAAHSGFFDLFVSPAINQTLQCISKCHQIKCGGSQEDVMSNHTASNFSKRNVVALPMQCQTIRRQNVESQETAAPRLNGFAGFISNRTHAKVDHMWNTKCDCCGMITKHYSMDNCQWHGWIFGRKQTSKYGSWQLPKKSKNTSPKMHNVCNQYSNSGVVRSCHIADLPV